MFLWLLIIGSQTCLIICPAIHTHTKDCDLGVKMPDNKVRVKFSYFRREGRILQDLTRNVKEAKGLRGSSEEEKTETTLATETRLYWNLTHERCDYERIRCMRAYSTGAVCARTLYYRYYSFPNQCALDFHNCMTRYNDIWSIAYMGICTEIETNLKYHVELSYDQMINNTFLTQMYAADSGYLTNVG